MRDWGDCARSNDSRSFDMQPTEIQSECISYKYSAGILSYRSTHKKTHVYTTSEHVHIEIDTETETQTKSQVIE